MNSDLEGKKDLKIEMPLNKPQKKGGKKSDSTKARRKSSKKVKLVSNLVH